MTRLTVFLALVCSVSLAAQAPRPVRIYLTSAGEMEGMTDPSKDNRDTVKDLRHSLTGKHGIAFAESRDDADVVLVVHDREKAQMTAGFFSNGRDCTVRVTVIHNGHESEMSASAQGGSLASGGAWGKAAGKVAKQVEEWVTANSVALTASK